jgi:hypothetical protein
MKEPDNYYLRKTCEYCKWYKCEPGHESYSGRCLHSKHKNELVIFEINETCDDWEEED